MTIAVKKALVPGELFVCNKIGPPTINIHKLIYQNWNKSINSLENKQPNDFHYIKIINHLIPYNFTLFSICIIVNRQELD